MKKLVTSILAFGMIFTAIGVSLVKTLILALPWEDNTSLC